MVSLVVPTAKYQKRTHHRPNPLHVAVFYEVFGGQGEGYSSAWLNVSMLWSFAIRSWLPNCTKESGPRSRTACYEDRSG